MLVQTVRRSVLAAMIMALMALVAGGTTGYGLVAAAMADTTTPRVCSTDPADNASGTFINRRIAVSFSEAMDQSSLSTATFTLQQGITPVAGSVTYRTIGNMAIFAPDSPLDTGTVYTGKLITAVQDTAGNNLASDYVWSFTTGVSVDTIRPAVIFTVPDTNAAGVSIYTAIAANFTETVDPGTFTTSSVMQGPTPVNGSLAYDTIGARITFTPDSNLLAGSIYTVTLSTAVTDLAGNTLDTDYVWSFTTGTPSIRAPIELGLAGEFVILAKTGISTTGTTYIVGDIGISPAAATYITGFGSLPYGDPPFNTYATSPLVDGKIYTPDYSPPTPTYVGTAVGDMETAYTVAAGQTIPDFTELYSGDISGKTLVRGLYKWGTGVLINDGVTLAGSATDVWIFQIAGTVTVGTGAIVSLSGGALPENIFWQVADQTTLGTYSQFKGIILDQTAVVIQTGASLNGRALAQSAVTLDANTVTSPTGIAGMPSVPVYGKLQLMPSRPNPASGPVRISYVLPRSGTVSLHVYDICGRRVNTLAQGQTQGGAYDLTWKGNDSRGRLLPAGVYFYQLTFDGASLTRRLVLLR